MDKKKQLTKIGMNDPFPDFLKKYTAVNTT